MGSNEVDWQMIPFTILQELFNPRCLCRCRPANFQRWIHTLDRIYCMPIQLEVTLASPCPKGFQVRFIPGFKEPLTDFVQAIAIHPMLCELMNERFPLFVVLGWSHVSLVAKDSFGS